jgi:uncharacterized phage-associated protein
VRGKAKLDGFYHRGSLRGDDMPTVAAYILRRNGEMIAMKLQHRTYYSQAWTLVWDERPLVAEPIEAWPQGAIVLSLYASHAGRFKASDSLHGPDAFELGQAETLDSVLAYHGNRPTLWLGVLVRRESPWAEAHRLSDPGADRRPEIPLASIAEYYSSL